MRIIETDQVYVAAVGHILSLLASATEPKLLLLSGGSAVGCYELLARGLSDGSELTIGLIDERYDREPTHARSNAAAIIATGLPDCVRKLGGKWEPILHGASLADEATGYGQLLQRFIGVAGSTTIGLLGIGADGHTAGVLPSDDAPWFQQKFESRELVVGYDSPDQYRQRVTVSLTALGLIDHLILMAADASKRPVVQRALTSSADHHTMPATIIQEARDVSVIMPRGK